AADLASAKADLKNFVINTLTPDQNAAITADQNYNTLSTELANQTTNLANELTPLQSLMSQLLSLEATVMQQYGQFAPMTGAAAQIEYSIPWDKLIQAYQNANPNAGVTFQT